VPRRQQGSRASVRRIRIHLAERLVEPAGHVVSAKRRALQGGLEQEWKLGLPGERNTGNLARADHELVHVAVLEPEVPQRILGAVPGECLAEEDAVDSTRRRACDHVDDHPQIGRLRTGVCELLEQFHVNALAVGGRCIRRFATCRRADETVDLLGDPVHVDAERRAAVTDEPKAYFLCRAGH
jgi:hypothetical protein